MKQLLRILNLRIDLWVHFQSNPQTPYRVVLRRIRHAGPWRPFWAWCSRIDGMVLEIGPVQQYRMQEALDMAHEQYLEIERRKEYPAATPWAAATDATGELEVHSLIRRLLPADRYEVRCSCGWCGAEPTLPGHMCLPEECHSCGTIHQQYLDHLRAVTKPTAGPVLVPRAPQHREAD
jgi:hypothetical protein